MALPSTLHHVALSWSLADLGIVGDVTLRVARHPSETMERLWLRVLAYAWKARDGITFGPGLCEPDAPDLVVEEPGRRAALVVRVGRPDPVRVERDVNQNAGAEVAVLFESPRRMSSFLDEARDRGLARAAAVEMAAIDPAMLSTLASIEDRRIRVSVTLVADHLYLEVDGRTLDAPLHRVAA